MFAWSRCIFGSRAASSTQDGLRLHVEAQAGPTRLEACKRPEFWHVLAARDEPAAPVVVVCCCITLCLSLCGSLWWCGVCRRGRSEWRSECAVTFHRVCMVWGHVYYDSKHSDSPGHVSTKQGHLWRKQLVLLLGVLTLVHVVTTPMVAALPVATPPLLEICITNGTKLTE